MPFVWVWFGTGSGHELTGNDIKDKTKMQLK